MVPAPPIPAPEGHPAGTIVRTPYGEGVVVSYDRIAGRYTLELNWKCRLHINHLRVRLPRTPDSSPERWGTLASTFKKAAQVLRRGSLDPKQAEDLQLENLDGGSSAGSDGDEDG
mmetsp:Transcript_19029/g.43729  ORF Transcript_19029/g.43729 Transcript_19029/m.43729 type:complete len:115 (+) Transcript_19029:777-1121(+)